ncbi:MAG: discoidin domain-containing protein, partial [Clostridia bacterium]|nr:discoidin domain-containing protein [Clostridia bacterium]
MKNFIRSLSLLLALLMCLGVFAACTDKGNTTDEPEESKDLSSLFSEEDSASASAPVSDPASSPESESEEQEEDIDIGPTTNVALNKPAYSNGGKDTAQKITDGNHKTSWSASGIPMYVEVDLQKNHKIKEVIVKIPQSAQPCAFNVYGSLDGVNFDRLAAMTQPESPAAK